MSECNACGRECGGTCYQYEPPESSSTKELAMAWVEQNTTVEPEYITQAVFARYYDCIRELDKEDIQASFIALASQPDIPFVDVMEFLDGASKEDITVFVEELNNWRDCL